MARQPYDPLNYIPSPDVIRDKLRETLTLAERLQILLDLSERLNIPPKTDATATALRKEGVAHVA